MDARNIDVQIIGPRPFRVMGFMEEHLTPNWARFINDCIKRQCDDFPDRFIGAAQLPQLSDAPDTTHVLGELERCVKELGFIATYASPDPGGRRTTPGMHEAYWHPLYAKCQEWDIPIIVHGTNALDRRFRVVPHNYQLGFYTEQYLATQFLGHGDVFQRFPELRVVVCHCGGGLDRFSKTDPHLPQKDLSQESLLRHLRLRDHLPRSRDQAARRRPHRLRQRSARLRPPRHPRNRPQRRRPRARHRLVRLPVQGRQDSDHERES